MDEALTAVKDVGFPIVVALFVLVRLDRTLQKVVHTLEKLTVLVERNHLRRSDGD